MRNRIKITLITLTLCLSWIYTLTAQNPQLAMHYYNRGEFEKAEALFRDLVKTQPENSVYFEKLMDCLTQLRNYDEALTEIDRRIQRFPNDPVNHYLKGNIHELRQESDEAIASFDQAVEVASRNPSSITRLAQEFQERGKFEYALKSYEASRTNGQVHPSFTLPMASLYFRLGDFENMIDSYLAAVDYRPESVSFVLNYFQRYLPDDHIEILQKKTIQKLQESSNEGFNEILAWAYIQDHNYAMAYRQLRSIDRRKQENGYRLYRLGQNAIQADEFEDAIRIFEYIIEDKGPHSPYYYTSHESILQSKNILLRQVPEEERLHRVKALVEEYLHLADSLGFNRLTAPLIKNIAEIQAFELHEYDAAITTLEKLIQITGINKNLLSSSKILLADIYLSTGDRWEATLLYSQVDKEHKEDEIGQLARFKNAKLSYYMGDFEWAQSQFDILRAATSRLIANDAIDMNIFIIDNLGLDTTVNNLKAYATADFHHFKNEDELALTKLDSLGRVLSPDHNLRDDILYLEARILRDNQRYEEAMAKYEQVVQEYSDGIWADNSLYAMAEIYLDKLDEPQRALEMYEKIFMEYDNSTFAVDARKKYRELRTNLGLEPQLNQPTRDSSRHQMVPNDSLNTPPPFNQN